MLYPTPWQRKILWAAITSLAVVAIGAVAVFVIWLFTRVLGFLQPLLIPFAVAGVLAYLLDPLVELLTRRTRLSRTWAVVIVFGIFMLAGAGFFVWLIPEIYQQSLVLAQKFPDYLESTRKFLVRIIESYQQQFAGSPYMTDATTWLKEQLPAVVEGSWTFIKTSVGGFLGVFGFVLGLVIIPIYLFFFLKEGRRISQHWAEYLPLRASKFKDEVVSLLEEINGYLIAFFRGQLIISGVDGVLTGIGLLILNLNFAMVIGLAICVFALIPYIGIILCWIPAVIIAAVQWQDWQHPLWVTAIFVFVQNLEGWFITPKVQSKSTGLHPLTIIVAVIVWTYLIGGLLGAILAVPLTATVKVLFKRYIWSRA